MSFSFRNVLLMAALVLGVLTGSFGKDLSVSAIPIQLLPGDLHWISNPKLHGLETVTLAGDPAAPGPYAERIKFPPNFRLQPHSHPNAARMVVVLSGTLYYTYGDQFDETKLTALPPSSFFTEPENVPHYAMTRDEEVVLQLNAIGPAATKTVEAEERSGK